MLPVRMELLGLFKKTRNGSFRVCLKKVNISFENPDLKPQKKTECFQFSTAMDQFCLHSWYAIKQIQIINYGKWSKSKVKHYVDNIKCAKLMTWMSTSRTVAPVPVPRLNMWTPSLPLPKMWSTAWNKIVITSYAMMLKFAVTMMPIMINAH